MSIEFKKPHDLLKAYRDGFLGSWCDPKDLDKLLGELPHPLFGAAAYDLYESGKGKLALPFKNLLKFDPGFGPAEKQLQGDCFAGDSIVLSHHCKHIKDVQIGDKIYGSSGSFTTVISKQVKISNNPLITIKTKGSIPLKVTSDHQVLIGRAEDQDNGSTQTRVISKKWVSAQEIKRGDYVVTPLYLDKEDKPLNRFTEDKDFVWFLGYFLGDGWCDNNNLEITFAQHQSHLFNRCSNILKRFGFNPRKCDYKGKNTSAFRLRCWCPELSTFLRSICYDFNKNKIFPNWGIGSKDIVDGLTSADGFTKDNKTTFDSKSTSLIYGVYYSYLEMGYQPTINYFYRAKKGAYKESQSYRVVCVKNKEKSYSIIREKELFIPVYEVKIEEGPHEVYDIGVNCKEHAFIANGCVAHNCVSHATRNAIDVTRSCEIINGEREDFVARGAVEGIYGSRGHGGEGMTCSGASRFVNKTGGLLIRRKYGSIDLSQYSNIGGRWGRSGVPAELINEAQKHKVKTVSLINTVAQARDALANGYSISVCSMSGFSSRRDKYGIAARSGSWAHAMTMIGMDDTHEIYKETLFLVQNCYSDDTEILTESGWFLFKDLPKDVKVATLNRETKTLEYHLPSQYQSFNYVGKMLHFKSQNKDCLVTPNHNMLYMNSNQVLLQHRGRLDFAEASKIKKTSKFIKFAQNWQPIHRPEKVNILGKDIDINLWLEFLGFFLSEGWSSVRTRERKRNSGIVTVETDGYTGISQNEGEVLEDMKRVCDLLPWKFSIKKLKKGKNHYQLVCYNLELATYMSKFGKAKDKYIPDYIFTLSRDKQKILFDTMMKGDGYSTGKGYTTCSIKLRDTFQQLCVHLGYSADYFLMHKAGDIVNGFTANHDFYRISVNKSEFIQGNSSIVSAGIPKEVDYNGVVYCVTVQNNTVLTRRNGKILWSGQSWGVWNGGPKRHDQPEGSFWIRERDAGQMLSENGSWVFSDVDGFPPRNVDWTLDKIF